MKYTRLNKGFKKNVMFFLLIIFACTISFSQTRDVPYTKELLSFIDSYFNHDIETRAQGEQLFNAAKNNVPAQFSIYQKETHYARCDYYFAQYIMETYDLTQLENALDDTSKEVEDPIEANKKIKAEAAVYFDSAIGHAKTAFKINGDNSPDAFSIYAQALSGNCTVKSISYVLANGLSISKYAKKAVKVDSTNATANFSVYAQDVYAPSIFGNPNYGRKKMTEFLNNDSFVSEKFDKFNFACAIAYTYYRQKNFQEAKVWYKKCLEIYPKNYAVTNLVKKCDEKLKG